MTARASATVGGGRCVAAIEVMPDLAEDPRPALRGAADHHRVGARCARARARLLGRGDVAVGDHRNRHRRLDGADRVVLDGADEGAGARAAVHGERADARVLGDARDRERVAVRRVGRRCGS